MSCLDATSCPSDRHVCDTTAHSCRGCIRDEECAGGICREVDGVCVADADVVFVSADGWTSGSCTRQAACAFLYGLSVATFTRPHMKIVAGPIVLSSPVTIRLNLYLEGEQTVISGPEGMFDLFQGVKVTLSHVRLQPASGSVAAVGAVQSLRLYDVQTNGGISVTSGVLDVDLSTFVGGPGIQCMSGTVTLQRSLFDNSPVQGMTCQLVVRRTHLDMSRDAGFVANGGTVIFENNLLTQSKGIADSMALVAVASSSVVRFNTFVNTDPEPSDGVALYCDSSMAVSSNIFAYQSMHPVSRDCNARYSIYDQVTLPAIAVGVENKVADSAALFVDRAAKNYHLSGTSPARGAGEPGLGISEDADGFPRPAPAGSHPDIGAFEAQ